MLVFGNSINSNVLYAQLIGAYGVDVIVSDVGCYTDVSVWSAKAANWDAIVIDVPHKPLFVRNFHPHPFLIVENNDMDSRMLSGLIWIPRITLGIGVPAHVITKWLACCVPFGWCNWYAHTIPINNQLYLTLRTKECDSIFASPSNYHLVIRRRYA